MTPTRARYFSLLVLTLIALGGCGGGGTKAIRVESPFDKTSLSLKLPEGWSLEGSPQNGIAVFSDAADVNYHGSVLFWEGGEMDLMSWYKDDYFNPAQAATRAGGPAEDIFEQMLASEELSVVAREIPGGEGLETIEDTQGLRQLRLFLKKETSVCEVFLTCPVEAWEESEALLRRSLESAKLD